MNVGSLNTAAMVVACILVVLIIATCWWIISDYEACRELGGVLFRGQCVDVEELRR